MKHCHYCKRPLNDPTDLTTADCGGDCLRCMAEVIEDPDCIKAMKVINDAKDKQEQSLRSD